MEQGASYVYYKMLGDRHRSHCSIARADEVATESQEKAKKVAVTGGAGRVGGKVIAELLGAGLAVISLDRAKPAADQGCPFVSVDFTDFRQTVGSR